MSGISLQKGGSVNLTKTQQAISLKKGTSGELRSIHVGLGWDVHSRVQADLDAFVVQLGPNNQVIETVYFGNKTSKDGAIRHSGDNLTGVGEGDDEVIIIDLDRLNPATQKVYVAVNIYQCRTTFNDVQNAFIRILNRETKDVLMHYNLTKDSGNNYALIMGELVKNPDNTWSFNAIGLATKDRNISEVTQRIRNGIVGQYTEVDATTVQVMASPSQPQNKGFLGRLFGR